MSPAGCTFDTRPTLCPAHSAMVALWLRIPPAPCDRDAKGGRPALQDLKNLERPAAGLPIRIMLE